MLDSSSLFEYISGLSGDDSSLSSSDTVFGCHCTASRVFHGIDRSTLRTGHGDGDCIKVRSIALTGGNPNPGKAVATKLNLPPSAPSAPEHFGKITNNSPSDVSGLIFEPASPARNRQVKEKYLNHIQAGTFQSLHKFGCNRRVNCLPLVARRTRWKFRTPPRSHGSLIPSQSQKSRQLQPKHCPNRFTNSMRPAPMNRSC